MNEEKIVMKEYRLWVKDGGLIKGKTLQPPGKTFADQVYLNLNTEGKSSLTFLDCTLKGVTIKPFELAYSEIKNCSFSECSIIDADIEYCAFDNVIFSHTSFNSFGRTLFDHCNFNNCTFNDCGWNRRMTNCKFYNCTFKNEEDIDAVGAHDIIDENCVLSQCKGVTTPSDYLDRYFERNQSDTGYIVYKTFGVTYPPCEEWDIFPGSILYENCDMNQLNPCSYGINVAPLEWVKAYTFKPDPRKVPDIWRCEILDRWLADVCVPYNTDGKIRCSKLRLIEIVRDN